MPLLRGMEWVERIGRVEGPVVSAGCRPLWLTPLCVVSFPLPQWIWFSELNRQWRDEPAKSTVCHMCNAPIRHE